MARKQDGRSELKVKIPGPLYAQLLGRKVLHGSTMAETLTAALDAHFARLEGR